MPSFPLHGRPNPFDSFWTLASASVTEVCVCVNVSRCGKKRTPNPKTSKANKIPLYRAAFHEGLPSFRGRGPNRKKTTHPHWNLCLHYYQSRYYSIFPFWRSVSATDRLLFCLVPNPFTSASQTEGKGFSFRCIHAWHDSWSDKGTHRTLTTIIIRMAHRVNGKDSQCVCFSGSNQSQRERPKVWDFFLVHFDIKFGPFPNPFPSVYVMPRWQTRGTWFLSFKLPNPACNPFPVRAAWIPEPHHADGKPVFFSGKSRSIGCFLFCLAFNICVDFT